MDTRNGAIYPSVELARAAGVPDDALAPMEPSGGHYIIHNGPFKGRMYRRNDLGQMVRDKAAEKAARDK